MNERRLQRKLDKELRLAHAPGGPDSTRFSLQRSGLVTASILGAALLGFGLLWHAHQGAAFHRLTTPEIPAVPGTPIAGASLTGTRDAGSTGTVQDAATVTRPVLHATIPELVSATVLPNQGMQVLQLAVNVPEHGVRTLLLAPSATEVANPPAAQTAGAPFHLLLLPADGSGESGAEAMASTAATNVSNLTQADGGEVTGTFTVLDAAGKPSGVEEKVDAILTGRSFDIDIRLRNNALVRRDFSLDWSPNFRAPDGDFSRWLLSIPAATELTASGVSAVSGTALDFSSARGKQVPNVDFDATFVALERSGIGDGPAVRLTDSQAGLVVRIVLLTPSIRSVRARTDSATHSLLLSFGTDEGTERTHLNAGESAEWRVRVEVLPLAAERPAQATTGY